MKHVCVSLRPYLLLTELLSDLFTETVSDTRRCLGCRRPFKAFSCCRVLNFRHHNYCLFGIYSYLGRLIVLPDALPRPTAGGAQIETHDFKHLMYSRTQRQGVHMQGRDNSSIRLER